MSSLETAITPITADQFGWGIMENSALFALIAFIGMLGVITTIILDKYGLSGVNIMIIGFTLIISGLVLGFLTGGGATVHLYGLLTFGGLLIFGIMLIASPNAAIYTRIVGTSGQGKFSGVNFIAGGIGRSIGPLVAGASLNSFNTHWMLFSVLAGVVVVTVVSMVHILPRLRNADRPTTEEHKELLGCVNGGDGDDSGNGSAVEPLLLARPT
jgi:MFS family permease